MNLRASTLTLLLSTTTAFAPPSHRSAGTSLHVATDPTAAGNKVLIPPSKIDASSVAKLFEARVQKTYGRYPITFVDGRGCWLTDEEGTKYLGEWWNYWIRIMIELLMPDFIWWFCFKLG
jgi:hypothetical protein